MIKIQRQQVVSSIYYCLFELIDTSLAAMQKKLPQPFGVQMFIIVIFFYSLSTSLNLHCTSSKLMTAHELIKSKFLRNIPCDCMHTENLPIFHIEIGCVVYVCVRLFQHRKFHDRLSKYFM